MRNDRRASGQQLLLRDELGDLDVRGLLAEGRRIVAGPEGHDDADGELASASTAVLNSSRSSLNTVPNVIQTIGGESALRGSGFAPGRNNCISPAWSEPKHGMRHRRDPVTNRREPGKNERYYIHIHHIYTQPVD